MTMTKRRKLKRFKITYVDFVWAADREEAMRVASRGLRFLIHYGFENCESIAQDMLRANANSKKLSLRLIG